MGVKKPGRKYIVRGKTYRAVSEHQCVGGVHNSSLEKGMAIYRCTPKGDKEIAFLFNVGWGGHGFWVQSRNSSWGFPTIKDAVKHFEEMGM